MLRVNDHDFSDTIRFIIIPSQNSCEMHSLVISLVNGKVNISLSLLLHQLNSQNNHWNWHWMLKLNYLLNGSFSLWNDTPEWRKNNSQIFMINCQILCGSADKRIHVFISLTKKKTYSRNNEWIWTFMLQKECQILCDV